MHLPNVFTAGRTGHEVRVEARAVALRKRSLQVVGDDFHQLLAGEIGRDVVGHWSPRLVSEMDWALHTLVLSLIGALAVGEVAFEPGAQAAAATVQEHALVPFGQLERRTHIRRRPSMDIT